MNRLITRASSINRALDQIGDKWCLLIFREIFLGSNGFNEMMAAIGVSRGVLSQRLKWLRSIDCLSKETDGTGSKRMRYHLTEKSIDLYDGALMALAWERRFYHSPELSDVTLTHLECGHAFEPQMRCRMCKDEVRMAEVGYEPGPGATRDEREKKVRRRSSISALDTPPGARRLYNNLIHLVGDRWTANVIALSFHGLTRFDQFHAELPVATNILSDRLKFLVAEEVFVQAAYQQRPVRHEYRLTEKGEALYPWFLSLLQWGDKWCSPDDSGKPMRLIHSPCARTLHGEVTCSACETALKAYQVKFDVGGLTVTPVGAERAEPMRAR